MTFSVPVSCIALIVTEQQRLGLERQVAVGDGDPQRLLRLAPPARGRLPPCRRRRGSAVARLGSVRHRAAQQPAIGQALARIHAVQRLLPAEQRVDEKVRRSPAARKS